MLLLVDANVLIDFVGADREVLALMVRHLGAIHVPRDVLDEVAALDEPTCTALGLRLVEGTLDQLTEAAARRGRLSFTDRMCLILARDHGWTCVTNDGRLRRECDAAGVPVMWGLQVLLGLVACGALTADAAVAVAEAIGRENVQLRAEVVAEFVRKVRGMEVG